MNSNLKLLGQGYRASERSSRHEARPTTPNTILRTPCEQTSLFAEFLLVARSLLTRTWLVAPSLAGDRVSS